MRIIGTAGVLLLMATLAEPAAAKSRAMMDAVTPDDVVGVLADMKLDAEVETEPDDLGGRRAVVHAETADGVRFHITFYACDSRRDPKRRRCAVSLFTASFESTEEQRDLTLVNGFNARQFFGRAYVKEDSGLLVLEHSADTTGGVSRGNLTDAVTTWLSLIDAFAEHFQHSGGESGSDVRRWGI